MSLTALVLKFRVEGETALLLRGVVAGVGHDGRFTAVAAALNCNRK